jgi:hypothetical protein
MCTFLMSRFSQNLALVLFYLTLKPKPVATVEHIEYMDMLRYNSVQVETGHIEVENRCKSVIMQEHVCWVQ